MVVQPGQALGITFADERPVNEVGLPALVWLADLQTQVAGLRPIARLGDDQVGPGQVPADGRRRHGDLVMVSDTNCNPWTEESEHRLSPLQAGRSAAA